MIGFPEIPPVPQTEGGYKTVKADPPWAYDDDLPGPGRGASEHYDTLHYRTVAGLGPQIQQITAPSAHLYLWTTNSFMSEAYEVIESWGFEAKTIITWIKVNDAPETLPFERDEPTSVKGKIGLGHYLRNTTEHIIFAAKGNRQTNRADAPTHFFAERGEHSSKPDKSYRLAEALSDGPRLEMFSRQARDGWTVWGDEAPDEPNAETEVVNGD